MSIQPGDKVEVQDRAGVTDLCVDGEQFYVLINNDGLLTVQDTDGFSSFNIPCRQVKKVKEESQLISELYKEAYDVEFRLYFANVSDATNFVSKVEKPKFEQSMDVKWFSA
ncbi:hypothetical protein ARR50_15485, partial [Listeria monocytogenes]|nr:hypothetical protein [Listeria monocytogenes]